MSENKNWADGPFVEVDLTSLALSEKMVKALTPLNRLAGVKVLKTHMTGVYNNNFPVFSAEFEVDGGRVIQFDVLPSEESSETDDWRLAILVDDLIETVDRSVVARIFHKSSVFLKHFVDCLTLDILTQFSNKQNLLPGSVEHESEGFMDVKVEPKSVDFETGKIDFDVFLFPKVPVNFINLTFDVAKEKNENACEHD